MAKAKIQCSTCEHYGAPRGRRLYHAHAYACLWMPKIDWPESYRTHLHYIPSMAHMEPGEGKDCSQWKPQSGVLERNYT